MKKYVKDFLLRGAVSCWGGPVILAIIYIICHFSGSAAEISTLEAAKAILSLTLMAFVAGGITVVYQIEKLPLFTAILAHGIVLYLDYLMMYFVNGWLAKGTGPFLFFTGIFILGYAVVWVIIYSVTRKSTQKLNRMLQ